MLFFDTRSSPKPWYLGFLLHWWLNGCSCGPSGVPWLVNINPCTNISYTLLHQHQHQLVHQIMHSLVLDILLAIFARLQSAKAKRIGLETHQSLSRSPIVGRSACHAATIRWPCSSLFIRSVNLKSIMGHTILKISHAPSLSCVQLYRRRDVLHMGQDVGYDEVWWTKYE